MKHISLFSGQGGFDLAAQWKGWENVAHCEINPFCLQILKYYWPNAISYNDIKTTDFSIHRGTIDILTGGFPCQPYSQAGKRKGKEDERHLWPEMLRAIREIQPGWVVGENVFGLINWNRGMVFDEVQTDLEAEGYEVWSYVLPACSQNAPHRRDRIWFIAYLNDEKQSTKTSNGEWQTCLQVRQRDEIRHIINWNDEMGFITNPDGSRTSKHRNGGEQPTAIRNNGQFDLSGNITDTECIRQSGSGRTERQGSAAAFGNGETSWTYPNDRWPTQSPVCGRNDGLSSELVGITLSKHRQESLKGYGNSVIPQIVLQIFKAIEQYNKLR